MPQVSVVIPVFNTENFIGRCLESIQAQTISDMEVICVDDCSSDRSPQIVKAFSRNDSRIRLIRHVKNLGAGGARNTGIGAARSSYLAFVDSDDYVDPNFLEFLYRSTDSGRIDVASCGYRMFDESGSTQWEYSPEDRLVDNSAKKTMMWGVMHPHFCDKIWRKSLFVDNEILLPTNAYFEDVFTIPLLLYHARTVRCGSKVLYHYFNRRGSTTNTSSKNHLIDLLLAMDNIKDFMIAKGVYRAESMEFRKFCENLFDFHARKLRENGMVDERDTQKFLRLASLLKQSYPSIDDRLRGL